MENDVDLRRCDLLARKLPEMEQWINEKCADDPAARWENTYICHQVQRRKSGEPMELETMDYIRAMTYAILSNSMDWRCVAHEADPQTGRLRNVDKALEARVDNEQDLSVAFEENQVRFRFKKRQIPAVEANIRRLNEAADLSAKYAKMSANGADFWPLVQAIANGKPEDGYKLAQIGSALACEYLRNLGYDIPKPDRHLCRLLGSERLQFFNQPMPESEEVYNLVRRVADRSKSNYGPAQADYILWSYCAIGYGNMCNGKNRACKNCCLSDLCAQK